MEQFAYLQNNDTLEACVNEFRFFEASVNPLNAKFTKWSNTLKQFVDKFPTYWLSVFDHFVGLAFKGLI